MITGTNILKLDVPHYQAKRPNAQWGYTFQGSLMCMSYTCISNADLQCFLSDLKAKLIFEAVRPNANSLARGGWGRNTKRKTSQSHAFRYFILNFNYHRWDFIMGWLRKFPSTNSAQNCVNRSTSFLGGQLSKTYKHFRLLLEIES